MTRLIKLDAGKRERDRLLKSIAICIKLYDNAMELEDKKDIIAYIIMTLDEVYRNIESSIEAWEKRGYWIKAERYKSEWLWAINSAQKLKEYILLEDWQSINQLIDDLRLKIYHIKTPQIPKDGLFCRGAWKKLSEKLNTSQKDV